MTGGASEEIARWRWDREHEAATHPSSRRIVYAVLEDGRLKQTRVRRLEDGRETVLPVALFEPRFSRDGQFIAGESSDQAVVVCGIAGSCRAITPALKLGVTSIGWSADGSRVFYLQRTSQAGWGQLSRSALLEAPSGHMVPSVLFARTRCLSTCRRATSCVRALPGGSPRALDGADTMIHDLVDAFLVTNFWEHVSTERESKQAAAIARATKAAGVAHAVWSTLEDTRLSFPLDDPRLKTLQGKYKVPHFDAKGEADAIFAAEGAPTGCDRRPRRESPDMAAKTATLHQKVCSTA